MTAKRIAALRNLIILKRKEEALREAQIFINKLKFSIWKR